MAEQVKDLVIIGSGPAGLSAAVYAKRAMLDVVVIEKAGFSGGQIVTTERVDNYLGLYGEIFASNEIQRTCGCTFCSLYRRRSEFRGK